MFTSEQTFLQTLIQESESAHLSMQTHFAPILSKQTIWNWQGSIWNWYGTIESNITWHLIERCTNSVIDWWTWKRTTSYRSAVIQTCWSMSCVIKPGFNFFGSCSLSQSCHTLIHTCQSICPHLELWTDNTFYLYSYMERLWPDDRRQI